MIKWNGKYSEPIDITNKSAPRGILCNLVWTISRYRVTACYKD